MDRDYPYRIERSPTKRWFIYVLMEPDGGDVFYVGQSTRPRQRLTQHINEAKCLLRRGVIGERREYQRIADILSMGNEPEMWVMTKCRTQTDATAMERILQERLDDGATALDSFKVDAEKLRG